MQAKPLVMLGRAARSGIHVDIGTPVCLARLHQLWLFEIGDLALPGLEVDDASGGPKPWAVHRNELAPVGIELHPTLLHQDTRKVTLRSDRCLL